jgi:hypothetical protein
LFDGVIDCIMSHITEDNSHALQNVLSMFFPHTTLTTNAELKEHFHEFFEFFSLIVFHRNVNWYYMQYYDAPIVGISQIVVNHAVSMIGMFSNWKIMSTMLFTDGSVVLQHENFANSFISKCIHSLKTSPP